MTLALTGASCGLFTKPVEKMDGQRVLRIEVPVGLPPLKYPENSRPTEAAVELGRKLFYDKNLSLDGTISCSSCHNPRYGFTDNRSTVIGLGGKIGTRNAPALFNVAYGQLFHWDGRAASLEAQAELPLTHAAEMGQTPAALEKRLTDNSIYRDMFERAFGPGPVTIAKTTRALAIFERLILSGNSLFDKFLYLGNTKALSQPAHRGYALFQKHCMVCHQIGREFALFTDHQFHNLGVGVDERGELTDLGRYLITREEADKGAFKTPTLRSIAQTRPYMHDGSLSSLSQVVEFYNRGGRPNRHQSKLIRPLDLTADDKLDLLAFLDSLSGEPVPHIGPPEGEQ
jgi:cytochrome c peroxidase